MIFFTRTVDSDSFLFVEVIIEAKHGQSTVQAPYGFLVLPLFKEEASPYHMPVYLGTRAELKNLTAENFKLQK